MDKLRTIPVGPYYFTDSRGQNVTYDFAPSCDYSQPGVNQAKGFNTVGETEGELKIFYQNVTEVKDVTIPEAGGYTASTLPLTFLNVDVAEVQTENTLFYAGLSYDILHVGPYEIPPQTLLDLFSEPSIFEAYYGPQMKIWYYCNGPMTLWGTMPYSKQITLTGVCQPGQDIPVFFDHEGNPVADKTVRELLDVLDEIVDARYEMEVLQGSANLYFSSKGPDSAMKHSTEIDADRIRGFSAQVSAWSTGEDSSLEAGYVRGPDFFFNPSNPGETKNITIGYTPPLGVSINKWTIGITGVSGECDKIRQDIQVSGLSGNAFSVSLRPGYIAGNIIPVEGRIVSDDLKEYRLEYAGPGGLTGRIKRKTGTISADEQILGIWNPAGLPEGEYELVLSAVDKNGGCAVDRRTIRYNDALNLVYTVYPATGTAFSPDYETAEAHFVLSKASLIDLVVKGSASGAEIRTLAEDQEFAAGAHVLEWDGRDSGGGIVPDGEYILEITARSLSTDEAGVPLDSIVRPESVTVFFIDKPLEMEISSGLDYFTPNGDGFNDEAVIHCTISETADIGIAIFDAQNQIVRTLSFPGQAAGEHRFVWDGRDENGEILYGTFRIDVAGVSTANPSDQADESTTVRVLQSSGTGGAEILNPVDNQIVNTTPGAVYSYTATAYGNYYPPVPVEWTISREGRSYWYETGNNSTIGFYYDMDQRKSIFGDKIDIWSVWATAPHAYNYSIYTYLDNTSGRASIAEVQRSGNSYRMKVHIWANAFQRTIAHYSLTAYGKFRRIDRWTNIRPSAEPLMVSRDQEEMMAYIPLQPDTPLHVYEAHSSVSPDNGYRYNLSSPYSEFLKSSLVLRPTNIIDGAVIGGFKVSSDYHEPWDSVEPSPVMTKEYNSVVFDPTRDVNSFSHDVFNDFGYAVPENVEITSWKIIIDSPDGAVALAPSSISSGDDRIGSEGVFDVVLNQTKEKRFVTVDLQVPSDAIRYSLYYTEGHDLSFSSWKTIEADRSVPLDGGHSLKWDATHLYGPYTLLLTVESEDGSVSESVRQVRLGSVVSREEGGAAVFRNTASSPYFLAELGFPPLAVPADAPDVDPATPGVQLLVDILPKSTDAVETDSNQKEIVGPVFDMKPNGIKFDRPVILKYRYDPEVLAGYGLTDESRFAIYHVKDDGTIEYLPGYVDKANRMVVVQISEFSKYVLVYDKTEVSPPEFVGLPESVNEQFFAPSGTAEPGSRILFSLNGKSGGETVADGNGLFSFAPVKLRPGENILSAEAINAQGIRSEARIAVVEYDMVPPNIVFDGAPLPEGGGFRKVYFSPNADGISDSCTIRAGMNEDGRLMFFLPDGSFSERVVKAGEMQTFTWDGAGAAEGTHILILSGEDKALNRSIDRFESIVEAVLDTTPPVLVGFGADHTNFSPNGDGVKDEAYVSLVIHDELSAESVIGLRVYSENGALVRTLIRDETCLNGNLSVVWDGLDQYGRALADGVYHITAKVTDLAGNTADRTISVRIDTAPPADERAISLTSEYISPNGDGVQDVIGIRYALNKQCSFSILIRDGEGTIRRRLVSDIYPAGAGVRPWDGKDDSGAVLADGKYQVVVSAHDSAGNRTEKILPVTVDTVSPQAEITFPHAASPVEGFVVFEGIASDENFLEYILSVSGEGYSYSLKGGSPVGGSPAIGGELGLWDTSALNGECQVVLTVKDMAGNSSAYAVSLILDNPPENGLIRISLPSGNLISTVRTQIVVSYGLSQDCVFRIDLKDDAGSVIGNLFEERPLPSGNYAFLWNGKTMNSVEYPDGAYRLVLSAFSVGPSEPVLREIPVRIDRTSPVILVESPEGDGFIAGLAEIKGTIIDPGLRNYTVEIASSSQPAEYLLVNYRKTVPADGVLAVFDSRTYDTEGYNIRVSAEDTGGNKASVTIPVSVDNSAPRIILSAPEKAGIVSGRTFGLTGSVLDENLERYYIEYLEDGVWILTDVRSDPVTNQGIGSVTVSENASGEIRFRVRAEDLAGNITLRTSFVRLDDTPPEAGITEPTGGLVSGRVSVAGFAHDPDFAWYQLAYRTESDPDTWAPVIRQYFPVFSGNLGQWNTAGLNGRTDLKLTAADHAGNISEKIVSLDIDNTAPDIRIRAPSIDGWYRGLVAISWTAFDAYGLEGFSVSVSGESGVSPVYAGSGTSCKWDTAPVPDGTYRIAVSGTDHVGLKSADYADIRIDNTHPIVTNIQVFPEIFHPRTASKSAMVCFDLSEEVRLDIKVLASNGHMVRQLVKGFRNTQGSMSEIWDGKGSSGSIVPEGLYLFSITAEDRAGNTTIRSISVRVGGDVEPPEISDISFLIDPFSPGVPDGRRDQTIVSYRIVDDISPSMRVSLSILDSSGAVIRSLFSDAQRTAGEHTDIWDGLDDGGTGVAEGAYYAEITARDGTGNQRTVQGASPVVVDNTPPELFVFQMPDPVISPNADGIADKAILTVYAGDNHSKIISNFGFSVTQDGTVLETVIGGISLKTEELVTFEWGNTNFTDGIYQASFSGYDQAGNALTHPEIPLKVDLTPPVSSCEVGIPSFQISNNSYLVGPDTPLYITSSDPIVNAVSSGFDRTEYRVWLAGSTVTNPIWTRWDEETGVSNPGGDEYWFEYRSVDKVGNIETRSQVKRRIRFKLDSEPPVISITSPQSYIWVNADIPITGSAYDMNFLSYRLILRDSQGVDRIIYPEVFQPVTNGCLGQLDVAGLPDGEYSLVLIALDRMGNRAEGYVVFTIGGPAVIGSFGSETLNKPAYAAVDKDGRLYVADENNKQLVRFDRAGVMESVVLSGVNQVRGVSLDGQGNIYLTERGAVSKYHPDGTAVWRYEDVTFPMNVRWNEPTGIWAADRNNNRLVNLSPDGVFQRELKNFGRNQTNDSLLAPSDMDFDTEGNMYVADSGNDRIVFLERQSGFASGRVFTSAQEFDRPEGISVFSRIAGVGADMSLIFVTDRNNDRARLFNAAGQLLYSYGRVSSGKPVLNKPAGIVFYAEENSLYPVVYVVDRNNDVIRKLSQEAGSGTEDAPATTNTQEAGAEPEMAAGILVRDNVCRIDDGEGIRIEYSLDGDQEASIVVCNMKGRTVRVLLDSRQPRGPGEAVWHGEDSSGQKVPSGLYYIRFKMNGKVTVAKVLVVK